MITSSQKLTLSYENLEKLFNKALEKEIKEWEKEKDEYVSDPYNIQGKVTGVYMPSSSIQVWLKIPKETCTKEVLKQLKKNIKLSGWKIRHFEWQINERTHATQLYVCIKKN